MTSPTRALLVTSALPYANGPIHIGHLLEYIQTDIWVRFQRMRGHDCTYVCADDAHGTPIMLKAREKGIAPEQLIAEVEVEHRADFADFGIGFDNYHTTHSDHNRVCSELIYHRLRELGHIVVRDVEQAYDPELGMFLPDRFIRGRCPRCDAADQYGDGCEICGATYTPTDLLEPLSVLSGAVPVMRVSEHYFVRLGDFEPMLRDWLQLGGEGRSPIQAEIANKLKEWFDTGLKDWDISRDAPYFGFQIPDAPGKYFYVWLDAPIGYMASVRHLCERRPELDFKRYWHPDSTVELYHFIGKDIAYFHTLFWPAMLHAAGFKKPTGIFCHGFLTVNGEKMSKSRGTFISARNYLKHLQPDYLRYYFACKLGAGIDDLDFNLDDFRQRVNADVIGKVVNIASRCAGFITRLFDGRLSHTLASPALFDQASASADEIATLYEAREYGKALRIVLLIADRTNRFIDDEKPWIQAKQPEAREHLHAVCTTGINLFRVLCVYLKPVLPQTVTRAESFLRIEPLRWSDLRSPLLGDAIDRFEPLLTRVREDQIAAMIEDSR